MDPITRMNQISGLITSQTKPSPQQSSALESFEHIFSSAVNNLTQKESKAGQAVASLAAGEDVELHQVMLATEEAGISFQLAMQVRNKLVEAYQEVMRMQV